MPRRLVIVAGRQSDGYTFRLHPKTRDRIVEKFPDIAGPDSVFIGFDTKGQFESIHGPVWEHVALLLTGLSKDQLEQFGGYRITDVIANRDLYKSRPPHHVPQT